MKIIFLIILILSTIANCQDEEETEEEKADRISSQWAFILYDLIDYYDELSNVHRNVLLHTSSYADKVKTELKYNRFLRDQSKQMSQIKEDDDDVPSDYQRMHEMLLKSYNAGLEDEDLVKLIEFSNSIQEMSETNTIDDPEDTNKILDKWDYENKLMTLRNISALETIWSNWQENITSGNYNFTEILLLIKKAVLLNDYNTTQFWESMVQYSEGYSVAKEIWREIEPFYKKFHQFVLDRINNYYKTNFTNIPVYLLGSKFGEDWSSLADIVLPHQQIYQDAITLLSEKSKKNIYMHCSSVADSLKFKQSNEEFWKKSTFNSEVCPGEVVSFSSNEYSVIITCNKTSWIQYLDMQEKAFDVGLRNLDYPSLPYRSLRDSFVEEGIQSLGSTIAVHNLAYDEFIEKDAFTTHLNATENLFTAKLLVALRVLPRLAYYYAVDNWRINELEYPTEDIVKSWWNERTKYQGVEGYSNNEMDFLEDEFIITNKPYLGKFLGTILQFSFLSQLDLSSEHTPNMIAQLIDQDFHSMLNDIPRKDPKDVISWHYSIDELSYYDIRSYFSQLEEYFENAPLEPNPFERRKLTKKTETPKIVETTTVVTVIEQTPKENISLSRKKADILNEVVDELPQNDAVPETAGGYSIGMYIVITVAACVLIMVALLVFKRLVKMRRPRTNNRRFEP